MSSLLFVSLTVQSQILVKDLNEGANDAVESYGTKSLQIEDKIYFIASTDGTKQALYVVNSITNDVDLLKELCNNCASSSQLFSYKGKLHFTNTESGVQKIYSTEGTRESVKLEFQYGKDSYSSIIIPTENRLYYYERNEGIHVFENGVDKIIPDTRFLDIIYRNSPDQNRVLVDGDKLLLIRKTALDTVALLEITEKVTILGKVNVAFSGADQHGLKKVRNGYIFANDGKLYNYKSSNKTMTALNLSAIKGSVLTLIDFKPNQPLIYVYNDGIFIVNDSESLSVTKISNIWDSVVQGTEFSKAYYGNKMLLLSSDFNTSFNDYAILTDGTIAGTYAEKITTYTSSLVQKGQHVFFAGGIINGFEPSIYYFDLDKKAPVEIKVFTEQSNNLTSIMPIGILGTRLYYFSNLDTKYGRELYYIETGVKTTTENIENASDYFTIKSVGNSFILDNKDNFSEQLELTIFDINGRFIKSIAINTGELFDLPNVSQLFIINAKSPLSNKQGVFKVIVH